MTKTDMTELIDETQCSFILGRQAVNNIALAKEVIHSMHKKTGKGGWFGAKLDLAKAYDRMNGDF